MPITAATIFGQVTKRLPASGMSPAFKRQLFGRALLAQAQSGLGLGTAQSLINAARRYGVGFRESQMRGILRAVNRHGPALARQLAADPAKVLTGRAISDATIRIPKSHRTYFRADVLDVQTGLTRRGTLIWDHDAPLSPDAAAKELRDRLERANKFGDYKRIVGPMSFSGQVKSNPDLEPAPF